MAGIWARLVNATRFSLAGRAKDMGSAAVFCAIVLAAAVWLLTLTGQ
jgi:diacylglycerol kinase